MDNVVYPRPDADWELLVEDVRANLRTGELSSSQLCSKWELQRAQYNNLRRLVLAQGSNRQPIPRNPHWGRALHRPVAQSRSTEEPEPHPAEEPTSHLPSVDWSATQPPTGVPSSQVSTVEETSSQILNAQAPSADNPSDTFDNPSTYSHEDLDRSHSTDVNVDEDPSAMVTPAATRHTPPPQTQPQPVLVELSINALPGTKVTISVGSTPASTVYTIVPATTNIAAQPPVNKIDEFIREQLASGIPRRTIANVLARDETSPTVEVYLRRIEQIELEDARRRLELGFDTPSTRQQADRVRVRYRAERRRMLERARAAKRHASGRQKDESDSDKENPNDSIRELY